MDVDLLPVGQPVAVGVGAVVPVDGDGARALGGVPLGVGLGDGDEVVAVVQLVVARGQVERPVPGAVDRELRAVEVVGLPIDDDDELVEVVGVVGPGDRRLRDEERARVDRHQRVGGQQIDEQLVGGGVVRRDRRVGVGSLHDRDIVEALGERRREAGQVEDPVPRAVDGERGVGERVGHAVHGDLERRRARAERGRVVGAGEHRKAGVADDHVHRGHEVVAVGERVRALVHLHTVGDAAAVRVGIQRVGERDQHLFVVGQSVAVGVLVVGIGLVDALLEVVRERVAVGVGDAAVDAHREGAGDRAGEVGVRVHEHVVALAVVVDEVTPRAGVDVGHGLEAVAAGLHAVRTGGDEPQLAVGHRHVGVGHRLVVPVHREAAAVVVDVELEQPIAAVRGLDVPSAVVELTHGEQDPAVVVPVGHRISGVVGPVPRDDVLARGRGAEQVDIVVGGDVVQAVAVDVADDVVGALDVALEHELAREHPRNGVVAVGVAGGEQIAVDLRGHDAERRDGRRAQVDRVLRGERVPGHGHGAAVGAGHALSVGRELPAVAGPPVGLELDHAVEAGQSAGYEHVEAAVERPGRREGIGVEAPVVAVHAADLRRSGAGHRDVPRHRRGPVALLGADADAIRAEHRGGVGLVVRQRRHLRAARVEHGDAAATLPADRLADLEDVGEQVGVGLEHLDRQSVLLGALRTRVVRCGARERGERQRDAGCAPQSRRAPPGCVRGLEHTRPGE